ncbi:MAG: ArsB/NhaD family transporter [Candidatus Thermoplasmatota archaeon]|nr:ArsB/NhaD family transporter [Candidatus Thermoplasmatota archaeon]
MVDASLLIAVGTMLAVYLLIATERMHRTSATLLGVAILLVVHFLGGFFHPALKIWHAASGSQGHAVTVELFQAITGPIDLNVVFLLFGMMVIVAVVARTQIFQHLAFRIYKAAEGRPLRLLLLLAIFTGLASAFLDNVTAMLLVTPISLELALVMGVNPVILLLTQVFASNLGGAFTLVGDPPNILIGSAAGLTFVDFLLGLTPAAIVSFVVYLLYVRWRYGDEVQAGSTPDPEELLELERAYALDSKRDAAAGVAVLAFVVLLFMLHGVLHMEVAVPALIGAGIAIAITQEDAVEILEEVEWPTLVFFMMLFVLVGAVEATGALDLVAQGVATVAAGNTVLAIVLVIWVSAILSGLVDNIPFTVTMIPVVASLVAPTGDFAGNTGLWWALALGADFGGNATLVGASANIVTAGLAERAGHPIEFVEFMKHGIPVMILTCLVGTLVLLLMFGGIL